MDVFHAGNIISTMGSWVMITGFVIVFVNLIRGAVSGPKATADPWGGKGLEWTISSPPPLENFDEIPVIK